MENNTNNNNENNNNNTENSNLILNPFMQFCKEHIEKNNDEFSLIDLGKIWDSLDEQKKNFYINSYNKLIKEKKNNKNKKKISVPLFHSKKIFSHGKYKKIPNSLNKKKPFN